MDFRAICVPLGRPQVATLQFLAASGYVVLYTNPRGSKGYGEAHTQAIRGCWGGPDFEDIQAAHRIMESNEAKGKMVVVRGIETSSVLRLKSDTLVSRSPKPVGFTCHWVHSVAS